jgi:uncharacterized protein YggU (UPF0235/DUF167 family)
MVSLNIKAKPGSFKNEISFDAEGTLVVKLREKPIDGAANEALITFLSKEFGLSKNSILLEKGQTSRYKKLQLHISDAELKILLEKYK